MPDLYSALKVRKNASKKAVKAAFRKRAKEAHPDCGGSREEFELLQLAYHALSDDDRRARYDVTGETDEKRQDSVLQETIQHIGGCLSAVLNGMVAAGQDPATVDLLELMRRQFNEAKKQLSSHRDETCRKRDKLARALGRFTVDEGENYLEQMVKGVVSPLDHQIADMAKELEKMNRAVEFLKKYKYKCLLDSYPADAKRAYLTTVFGIP